MDKLTIINNFVKKLTTISSIKAIVLGGSYASNTQRPDSDIDIGIYYSKSELLDITALKLIVDEINDKPNPIVTEIGGWGKWVNGGAWLTVHGQRIDLIYRDIDFVTETINNCINGKIEHDFGQQPAFGFQSYIYCAEIKICRVLYDQTSVIKKLKEKIREYSPKLKLRVINGFLWDAEFSLYHAKKSLVRNEDYIVNGCITRISNDLVQALYALNEEYFIGEKKLYKDIEKFKIQPDDFLSRIQNISDLNNTISNYEKLINEMKVLCGQLYKPRFIL